MITFTAVRWKNFLSTGNTFTDIILDSNPTTLIIGENGAGKSTILDALCFGLFGRPFRNIKKDQLINSVNNKNCLVEVEFTIGKHNYVVRRGIRPGKFEIDIDGITQPRLASVRDQQRQLEMNILKLSYQSFTQIVILGNASFIPFMQLRAQERREIIEDLLDITIFTSMNELLKNRISQNKEELARVKYELDLIVEKLDVHESNLESLKKNAKVRYDKLLKEIDKATKFIEKANVEVEKLDERIIRFDEQSKEEPVLKSKLAKIDGIEARLEEKKKENKAQISFYEENTACPTCGQSLEEEFINGKVNEHSCTITEIDDALGKLNEEVDKVTLKLQDMAEIIQKKDTLVTKKIEVASSITQQNQYINRINKEIDDHNEDTGNLDSEKLIIKDLKKDVKSSRKSHESLAHQRALYEAAWKLLRDGGIKTAIIKQYVPIINQLVNKYLSALEFFVQFELDEKFNEVIKSRHRDEFTYASFSEGEKMRIDLALLFTWRAIARMKNSTNTNLLILDEVFDASLDTNGCEEFLKLINQLGEDNRVFVISHKGDILQDKFTSTIHFEKHKNFSRVA